jgi:predicted dehydrogenase
VTDAELLAKRTVSLVSPEAAPTGRPSSEPAVGFVGAGNYARRILIPAFKKTGVRLETVASSGGVSAVHAGRTFGFRRATTSAADLIADSGINVVVIASPHDQHARQACDALRAGKHVFVEKPLATTRDDLRALEEAHASSRSQSAPPLLVVGFNRRFAPHTQRIKHLIQGLSEPKAFVMTVNAGRVPEDHWVQDPSVGGGRIVGEACHFIDLLRYLAGQPIVSTHTVSLRSKRASPVPPDNVSFTLSFADGSVGTVHYLADGHRAFPKERLEVFCAGRIIQLDNFRRMRVFGWRGLRRMNLWKQDKGQAHCVAAFIHAVRSGGPSPTPFEEMTEVTRVSFDVAEAAEG